MASILLLYSISRESLFTLHLSHRYLTLFTERVLRRYRLVRHLPAGRFPPVLPAEESSSFPRRSPSAPTQCRPCRAWEKGSHCPDQTVRGRQRYTCIYMDMRGYVSRKVDDINAYKRVQSSTPPLYLYTSTDQLTHARAKETETETESEMETDSPVSRTEREGWREIRCSLWLVFQLNL
jgi:hypothetical protein